VGGFFQWL